MELLLQQVNNREPDTQSCKDSICSTFQVCRPRIGAALFEGKRSLLQRVCPGQGFNKSLDLKHSFFGHIVTHSVTRWQEGRDAKELVKGNRSFLVSERCVFLLHVSGETHCLSQSKEGSKRGKPHCQNTQRFARWTAASPLIYACSYGSTDGVSKTAFCPTILI